jgi:hypothetical protein
MSTTSITTTTDHLVASLRVTKPEGRADVLIPPTFLLSPAPNLKVQTINFNEHGLDDLSSSWAWVLDGVLSIEECNLLIRASKIRFDHGHWDRILSTEDENWQHVHELTRKCHRAFWDLENVWERLWKRIEGKVGKVKVLRDVPGVTGMQEWRADGKKMVWSLTRANERARFIKYEEGEFINGLLSMQIFSEV